MKSLSFKKVSDGQSDIISQLSKSFYFYKFLFEVKKIDETLELKFLLMFFDSVCPTRPSDTVTKYNIYPTILLMERIYKWS